MKKSTKFLFVLATILIFSFTLAGSALADNHGDGCQIPEAGPWPPCATGGEATDAWKNAGNASNSNSGGASDAAGMESSGSTVGANDLIGAMEELRFLLEQMGGLLDRLNAGSGESCGEYNSYYEGIGALPVFDNVPAAWQGLHQFYIDAALGALESNKDIYLLCNDGGGAPSALNYGIARTGINEALNKINAGIAAANEMVDAPPAATAPPAADPAPPAADTPPPPPAEDTPPPPPPAEEPPAPPAEEPPAEEPPAATTPRPLPTEQQITDAATRLYADYDGPRAAARVIFDIPQIDDAGLVNPPSVEFAPLDFLVSAVVVSSGVNNMGGLIDRLLRGSGESCADFAGSFITVAISPKFNNVPAAWQGLVNQYEAAIDKLIDTNKDFVTNACLTGGAFSEFNFWRARAGINDALDLINPVVEAAAEAYVMGK